MKLKNYSLRFLTVFAFSLFLLTSCGGGGNESPDTVMQKFKEAAVEVNSGDLSFAVDVQGFDQQDEINLKAKADVMFDRREDMDRKANIGITLSGKMKAAEQSLDGDVNFDIRSVGTDYYLRLSKLESTDASLAQIQPLIQGYTGKWLHLAPDFVPENLRQLQEKDAETLAKEEQMKALFLNTNLFEVVKEYGTETVNGNKVYHYGVQVSEAGFKDYIKKTALIDGREVTEADLEDAGKMVAEIDSLDFWIGVKDYYLYKATAAFKTGAEDPGVDMSVQLTLEGDDYNSDIAIDAPEGAQEFNPLEVLMMGAAMQGGLGAPADEAAMTDDSAVPAVDDAMMGDDGAEE